VTGGPGVWVKIRNWYWSIKLPPETLIAIAFDGSIDKTSADYLVRKGAEKLDKKYPKVDWPPVGSRVVIKNGESAGQKGMVDLHDRRSPTDCKLWVQLGNNRMCVVDLGEVQLDERIMEVDADLQSPITALRLSALKLENMSRHHMDANWIETMKGELEGTRRFVESLEAYLQKAPKAS